MAPQSAAMAVIAPTQIPTISPTLSFGGLFPFPFPFPLPKRLKNMCLEVLKIVNQEAAPDKFSRATVNDLIDAHSQINATYRLKINTPSTPLSLYWTTLSNKHPLSNR